MEARQGTREANCRKVRGRRQRFCIFHAITERNRAGEQTRSTGRGPSGILGMAGQAEISARVPGPA